MHSAVISLKDRQIEQLLKLQELFHSHYLTEQLLNQMISLYVKFVEHIQHNQHPLRLYFMEKIRFVLSRPEVNKILEKESLGEKSIRQTVRQIMGKREEEELEIKRLAEEAREEVRNLHIINLKKQRPLQQPPQLREQQRSIKIAMQMKIMEEVEQNIQKLRNDFSKNTQKSKEKTKEIDKIVNNQDQRLAERRANRKKKLRKKSADLNEKEVEIIEAPPINRQELKLVQMIVHQTFERFTRLTQNKAMHESNQKPNQGRVKIQLQQKQYKDEQDMFQPKIPEETQPPKSNFSKKKSTAVQESPKKQEEKPIVPARETTVVQYKTFEQNKGRVTVRNNQYEQIEDDI